MLIVGLADAYSTDLGGNKVMDGANIFSNLVQTFGNPIEGANTADSNSNSTSTKY
ncbi:hypothetical protein [Flavobacterium sp. ENC]|uniref:hypothetical protein n=1 Tax=Flavobacterium sp. ENC TaxID=2897330 RepID=UPI001E2D6244|nr:hypothetical protein [Flavobacterium sp. ENC]MCD0464146.1 hypothetical protein [Flavobacterium sp. ENC]